MANVYSTDASSLGRTPPTPDSNWSVYRFEPSLPYLVVPLVVLPRPSAAPVHHPTAPPPQCAVIEAARFGHHEILGRLLSLGANGHASEGSGWTAMDWAAQYGHHECISVLFWHLGPENVTTHKGIEKTLALTAAKGFLPCVRVLRINVDFRREALEAALSEARRWGKTSIVEPELTRPGDEYLGEREAFSRERRWRERRWLALVHHRHRLAFLEARARGSRAQVVPDMSSLTPRVLRMVGHFLV